MAKRNVDVLIIGQGLAGSLLAWELQRRGRSVVVVDDDHASSSSRAAAGLVNAIVGTRLVKTEDAELLVPAARALYRKLEAAFDRRFFHERPMLRLFRTDQERARWEERRQDPEYRAWINESWPIGEPPAAVHAPLGGFVQHRTGFLDTNALLDTLRDHLDQQQNRIVARIDPAAVTPVGDEVQWQAITARCAIFCEGYRLRDNPWFDWLPMKPIKGEILTLHSRKPLPRAIINAGKWIVPFEDELFRLGATYDHDRLDTLPTHEAREQLLAALPALLQQPPACEVVAHRVGIRPRSGDRRPLLGFHPHHAGLGVFNGFGSHGALLIPWYASRMADRIDGINTIPASADIRRFALPGA